MTLKIEHYTHLGGNSKSFWKQTACIPIYVLMFEHDYSLTMKYTLLVRE